MSSSSSTSQVSFFPPKPRFSFQSFPSQQTSWAKRVKEKVKLVQYISPYMKYLLVFTQHPQVIIAGSVHRCTGSYSGKCVVAREQVISSTTHSLSCHSYAPVNFHKLYPSMSTNWSWDCGLRRDVWVSWSRSVSNDVTSKFFKRGKGSSLLLSFTVFTYWKSSKCKKSLLFYSESYTWLFCVDEFDLVPMLKSFVTFSHRCPKRNMRVCIGKIEVET